MRLTLDTKETKRIKRAKRHNVREGWAHRARQKTQDSNGQRANSSDARQRNIAREVNKT